MSQEAFFYQVQMEEEYMSKMKDFVEELKAELLLSDQQFCVYCGSERENDSCCGEHHFSTFEYMVDEVKTLILNAEIKQYEEATK